MNTDKAIRGLCRHHLEMSRARSTNGRTDSASSRSTWTNPTAWSIIREIEQAIVITSDTKKENTLFCDYQRLSAFIRGSMSHEP